MPPQIPDPIPVNVGDVLTLQKQDYKFGLGPITVRVVGVVRIVHLQDGPWLQVQAMQLHDNGSDWQRRFILVRLSALPGAQQPPNQ